MRLIFIVTMAALMIGQAAAKDVLSGASLYEDVARYASFGLHRFGSPGDRATAGWIAGELSAAGLAIKFQPVVLAGNMSSNGPALKPSARLSRRRRSGGRLKTRPASIFPPRWRATATSPKRFSGSTCRSIAAPISAPAIARRSLKPQRRSPPPSC
jgi:hypothetical protein